MKFKLKKILSLAIIIFTITVKAQTDDYKYITEVRSSEAYHFIQIKGEMNIKLIEKSKPGLILEGTSYQVDNIVTILQNDTLFVNQVNKQIGISKPQLTINIENLALLDVSGKSITDLSAVNISDYMTIRVHDGARIKLDLHAPQETSKSKNDNLVKSNSAQN